MCLLSISVLLVPMITLFTRLFVFLVNHSRSYQSASVLIHCGLRFVTNHRPKPEIGYKICSDKER
ncbi:hypothetical protein BDQ12DRAFT_675182 [Crucibulum laeve]|uniref:Uncharacterized protein n=1 Tax=Crucibulum laeve TaxID=68775 RepID=A0A5C3MGN7_9AGAR|nr:hypothetical protein BDQ12DRAFT_675182 [Crucibulum laeve]